DKSCHVSHCRVVAGKSSGPHRQCGERTRDSTSGIHGPADAGNTIQHAEEALFVRDRPRRKRASDGGEERARLVFHRRTPAVFSAAGFSGVAFPGARLERTAPNTIWGDVFL